VLVQTENWKLKGERSCYEKNMVVAWVHIYY
jgi:hypothetical protein